MSFKKKPAADFSATGSHVYAITEGARIVPDPNAARKSHAGLIRRAASFIKYAIRLRSLSRAAWVDAYESHIPEHEHELLDPSAR